jgi:hypothetical protein
MIAYQKKFLRIAEYWGTEPDRNLQVDLVRFFQHSEPLADAFCREFYSIVLDLRRDETALFSKMKRKTRYEIRRAKMSDQFVYQVANGEDSAVLSEFIDNHDQFAAHKGQAKINHLWVSTVAAGGLLKISRIQDHTGRTLVWHAYHIGFERATLLYSASILRPESDGNLRTRVGRANRYHHWQDILHFKQLGLTIYDFGGWYEKKEDRARLNINKFKEGFGGDIVKTYICERPLTLRGWVFLKTRTLLLGNAI